MVDESTKKRILDCYKSQLNEKYSNDVLSILDGNLDLYFNKDLKYQEMLLKTLGYLYLEHHNCEDTIRKILERELIFCEENYCVCNLPYLISLLKHYHREKDNQLFIRCNEASFDCHFACDLNIKPFDEFNSQDIVYIQIAIDCQMLDLAKYLTDSLKDSIIEETYSNYNILEMLYRKLDDFDGQLYCHQKRLEISEGSSDILNDILKLAIEYNNKKLAYDTILKIKFSYENPWTWETILEYMLKYQDFSFYRWVISKVKGKCMATSYEDWVLICDIAKIQKDYVTYRYYLRKINKYRSNGNSAFKPMRNGKGFYRAIF